MVLLINSHVKISPFLDKYIANFRNLKIEFK